jgi:hypothetical protein
MDKTKQEEFLARREALMNLERECENLGDALIDEFSLLDDDLFWKAIDAIRLEIDLLDDKKSIGGILNEFFRSVVVERDWDKWCKAVGFLRTYEAKCSPLYSMKVYKGYAGDDTHGDICDSFPLNGKEVYEKAFQGVKIPVGHLDHEWYCQTTMREACRLHMRSALESKKTAPAPSSSPRSLAEKWLGQ